MSTQTIGVDLRGLSHGVQTGVGAYAKGLLQAIFAQDTKHQYIIFDNHLGACQPPDWVSDRVTTVHTRYPNKVLGASFYSVSRPYIDRIIERRAASLDYLFSPNINMTSVSPNTKHILTIHDLSFEHYPTYFSWKQRAWHAAARPKKQCEQAYAIVTPSAFTRSDVIETYGIPQNQVHVVSPGISQPTVSQERIDRVKKTYNLPERFVFFLGTIEPRKNIQSLVEAFGLLNRKNEQLIIAGASGWKNKRLLSLINDTPGVRYIGYVRAEEKQALYSLATLMVYPSMYEGFGFPLLEAMAAGAPVITSHHGSLSEVAADAAYYVQPRNVSEIATAIQTLLDNHSLRQQYVSKGYERVQQFSWERAASQWLSCL